MTAALVPKTLFGEKYVELNIPKDASSSSLEAGDKIEQTDLPIEVERVLNDLYPLLRTVQPAEINYTLNALATALEGRGDKIGESFVTLDSYLKRLNPQIPDIIADIKLLATVTDTYADVMPAIADTLRNTVKTGNTLVSKEEKLNAFLVDLTAFSDTTKAFLDDNGDNIIRLGQLSEPILALLSRYSSEFPCLIDGLVRQAPRLADTFRGFIFHINLKLLPKQPRGYTNADRQVYGANNGPNCAGLPVPPEPYYPSSPQYERRCEQPGKGDNQRPATGFANQRSSLGAGRERDRLGQGAAQLAHRPDARGAGRPDVRRRLAPLRPGHGRHRGERRMSILDKKTGGDLVKLVIFIVVTTMATGVLVVLIGNLSFTKTRDYKAVFSDATGVVKGDDIRIAGVKVGSVQGVKIVDREHAMVSFNVAEDSVVTKSSTATIRYRNLVGQRYIQLTQGVGDLGRLPADGTIPMDRTEPALDLTVLFNGFKPLFAALSPTDINKLSAEVISVFQGEGDNFNGLLQSTASLTNTLADRDQVIGDLIDNLNIVLETLSSRDKQLSELIIEFKDFMSGLVQDKDAILNSLDSVSALANETSDLAVGIRPAFVRDVKGLRQVATNLNRGRSEIDRALQIMPIKLTKIGRTAINGSFFNFYLCQFQGNVLVPGATPISFEYGTSAVFETERCHLG